MEPAIAVLVGLFVAAAIYLLLSRALIRVLLGLVLLGNGVNLLIFVGRPADPRRAADRPAGQATIAGPFANPLPQALILTAIVIGFAMFAFLACSPSAPTRRSTPTTPTACASPNREGEPHPPLEY